MISEQGIVKRTVGTKAWVVTTRSEMCEACASQGACTVLGGGKEMEVEAINVAQAKPGDQVLLTLEDQSLIKLSFLVYMFPILALIAGAALGQSGASPFDQSRVGLFRARSYCIWTCFSHREEKRQENGANGVHNPQSGANH